jgi:hypothetical protein
MLLNAPVTVKHSLMLGWPATASCIAQSASCMHSTGLHEPSGARHKLYRYLTMYLRSSHYPERCSKPGEASTSGREQYDQLVRFADIGCGFGGLLVK